MNSPTCNSSVAPPRHSPLHPRPEWDKMAAMKEKIKIIEQRQGWICLEKPGGMSVHNDPGKDVISELQKHLSPGSTEILQPVHRLDKETSGLLLVATDRNTLAGLSDLFAGGKVTKRYKALVHGHFDHPGQTRGTWDTPLTKSAGGRTDPRGRENGSSR